MFSEISRDDVFRLETRNLWLRWPMDADAAVGAAPVGRAGLPEDAAGDPYRGDQDRGNQDRGDKDRGDAPSGDPYRDCDTLLTWRRANASGRELHLVLTGRGRDRLPLGAVDLVPLRGRPEDCGLRLRVWLDAPARGRGLGTEALQAMVDAAFMLTEAPLVSASSRVLDPAFRRVLEKCGFTSCGTGLAPAADGRGLVASDRFRLDRKAWASLKGWRVPGLRGSGPAKEPGFGPAKDLRSGCPG